MLAASGTAQNVPAGLVWNSPRDGIFGPDTLDVQAPIETFGPGARGFNLYDGSLNQATFQSIATRGDQLIVIVHAAWHEG